MDDRTQNQAINNKTGRSNAAVTADLNGLAAVQGNAQADINKLNGGSGDAAISNTLKTKFEGGATTNANALAHVSSQVFILDFPRYSQLTPCSKLRVVSRSSLVWFGGRRTRISSL